MRYVLGVKIFNNMLWVLIKNGVVMLCRNFVVWLSGVGIINIFS